MAQRLYAKQFKSILYLSNVETGNGPFQLIEKQKTLHLIFNYFTSMKNLKILDFQKMR